MTTFTTQKNFLSLGQLKPAVEGHVATYFNYGHCGLNNSTVVGVAKSRLPGSFPFGCFALGNIKHLPRAKS